MNSIITKIESSYQGHWQVMSTHLNVLNTKLSHSLKSAFAWATSKISVEVADSWYVQAQQDPTFISISDNCANAEKQYQLLKTLLKQSIDPVTFHNLLLLQVQFNADNSESPAFYAALLDRLSNHSKRVNLPDAIQSSIEEAKVRFQEQLREKKDQEAIFLNDALYHLILLSGQQLSGKRLLNRLMQYKGLINNSVLQTVYQTFKELISTYFSENDLSPFDVKDIPKAAYKKVISSLERAIPLPNISKNQQLITSLNQIISQGYSTLKSHPYKVVTGVFVASMAYLYGHKSMTAGIQLYSGGGLLSVNSLPWHHLNTLLPFSLGATYSGYSHSAWMSVATFSLLSEIASSLPMSSALFFNSPYNLSSINGDNGFLVNGIANSDYTGISICSGDVNGDGYDDFLICAAGYINRAHCDVVFGSKEPFPTNVNLVSLNGINGFAITGFYSDGGAFIVISSGDINGDGYADALIGVGSAPSDTFKGQVYVVFGSPNPFPATLNVANLNGTNGFTIMGINDADELGFAIGSGNINGDKYAELLIGAPQGTSIGDNIGPGKVFVIFGAPTFLANFDLSSLNNSTGFVVQGIITGDGFGSSLDSGDINGDGLDDILIGAPLAPYVKDTTGTGSTGQGQISVVFGSLNPFSSIIYAANFTGNDGFTINGINKGDGCGSAITCGDINNDGYKDVLIGASYANAYRGQSYAFYGSNITFPALFNLSSLDANKGFLVNGVDNYAYSGFSMSSADVNGDKIDDWLIGGPYYPLNVNIGKCYAIYGSSVPFSDTFSLAQLNGTDGFVINGIYNDGYFGYALGTGDINGDKIADLLMGAWNAPSGSNTGQGYVLYGGPGNTSITTGSITTASITTGSIPTGSTTSVVTTGTSLAMTTNFVTNPQSNLSSSSGNTILLAGAIAGSIGGALCLVGVVGFFYYRKKKQSNGTNNETASEMQNFDSRQVYTNQAIPRSTRNLLQISNRQISVSDVYANVPPESSNTEYANVPHENRSNTISTNAPNHPRHEDFSALDETSPTRDRPRSTSNAPNQPVTYVDFSVLQANVNSPNSIANSSNSHEYETLPILEEPHAIASTSTEYGELPS